VLELPNAGATNTCRRVRIVDGIQSGGSDGIQFSFIADLGVKFGRQGTRRSRRDIDEI
jgi:hypothetical protein